MPRDRSTVRFASATKGCFSLSFLIFAFVASAHAQQVSGNLRGKILDSLGQPVPFVNIVVKGPFLQGVRGGVSGDDGYFSILALPPGTISVTVSHVGYQSVVFEDVLIQLGRTTSLGEVRLHAQSHDLPEVVVSSSRPLIDPLTTSYGANLRAKEFENLPVDRNYRSIAALIPQANASFYGDEVNIGGGTGSENRYFIDGVDVTDPAFGLTGTNLPYNFAEEIEVTTGGYQAEYRSSLGGLINVTTPSGGNEMHGSVFGFYTSNRLTASRRIGLSDPTQGGFSNYDVGFDIGGPILRDELWFYGAYNPTFNQRDVDMPGNGVAVDKTVMHAFAGKLTWRASDRLNLVLTSTGDLSERTAIGDFPLFVFAPAHLENPDPYLTDEAGGGINASLRGSYLTANGALFEASISRIARRQTNEPSTDRGKNEIVFINTETGSWSGGSFGTLSMDREVRDARIVGTFLAGAHNIKGGIEYRDNAVDADVNYANSLSRYTDTLYTLVLNVTHGTIHNRVPSAFVQDRWQIAPGLWLNAGLRWDGQFIIGADGNLAQRITTPLQPRIGVILSPDNEGNQKMFAWFGRFADELSTAALTAYYTGTGYYYEIHYDHDPRTGGTSRDTSNPLYPAIQPEVKGFTGQYFDEFSLGYERAIGSTFKISVQGTYRTLRVAVDDGNVAQKGFVFGNPGSGLLSDFPKPQRDYEALVVSISRQGSEHFNFIASYVLSRNYGNYEGFYDSFNHNIVPNVSFTFDNVYALEKATGLLPNDRTHVFKFSGTYRFDFGLVAGTSFMLGSGTPLSEVAGAGLFLQPRGTVGRTPAIWDLSFRAVYPILLFSGTRAQLILDLLHIASQREPVDIDQKRYLVDNNGVPESPNPTYGFAYRYQPPMSIRLGMEVNF